ncbi:zf-RING_2 domain-containing protein [Cephalotus follicularis]|uniref:RING-type E3 ubiquitin transferase n=1 Tax=Cephalotus follicularis TaxID=3775 RepID=A0A1Q3C4G8_CEPFO|nr:zf-RING_2 domain-containing protein [Cephalotus follicularis]
MRPPPADEAINHPTTPAPLSSVRETSTCNPNTCRWRPYSNANDFETNAIMVLIILLCTFICALALKVAIRCFLPGGSQRSAEHQLAQASQDDVEKRKSNLQAAAASTLVFSGGMKQQLAGEAECAICLSEFVEGDGIEVLKGCRHGFHKYCIQQWLSSHLSCPTCRRSTCLSSSPSPLEEDNPGCTILVPSQDHNSHTPKQMGLKQKKNLKEQGVQPMYLRKGGPLCAPDKSVLLLPVKRV